MLLSKGADVNAKGEDNITPLHIAAKRGYIDIAKYLLEHGACIHSSTLKEEYTPLHFAAEQGNEEAVKLFLVRGADVNATTQKKLTPLHIATTRGNIKVVRLLLQHGGKVDSQDKDGNTILYLAVHKGYFQIVKEVLKYCPDVNNANNRSSLKIAVYRHGEEYKNIVEVLLDYGLAVCHKDADNTRLLHEAVERGYLKIVELLLKYGANVNALHNSLYKEWFTPLHCAVDSKQEDVAKLLISYGADINAKDKIGKTPIFYALYNDDLKITKLLLANRANVKDNPEPLIIAVTRECIEIVEILLQYGADINAPDEDGRTALHYAFQIGHVVGVETLLEYGADINVTTRLYGTPLNNSGVYDFELVRNNHRYFYGCNRHHIYDCKCKETAETLSRHVIKMNTANLYVSEKNLRLVKLWHGKSDFVCECEKEIIALKSEKINNTNVSFYDILTKSTNSIAIYARNENTVQVLKGDEYKMKFPIYASIIKNHFRTGIARKELIEQSNIIVHFFFNSVVELPSDCTEEICSYLNNEDIKVLVEACRSFSITYPNGKVIS